MRRHSIEKMTAAEVEVAVARHFDPRLHVIVPNVSWGMGLHECDMLVLTKTGYAYEVEIKTSRSDLIRDQRKRHNHRSNKIHKLFFAMPWYMREHMCHVPAHAGVLLVSAGGYCECVRDAHRQEAQKWGIEDRFRLARLGTMRIWTLKRALLKLREEVCDGHQEEKEGGEEEGSQEKEEGRPPRT